MGEARAALASPPVAFYDGFVRRLLRDYVTGNPRATAALLKALAFVPDGAMRILDVGCGIGWSTFEIARHRPDALVDGVDLSPALVDTATALFAEEARVRFQVADFLEAELPTGAFGAAVLLDVYEHFPSSRRPQVHARLDALLARDARLVMTTPTVEHQAYLRREDPDGLQPVDEDVTPGDLERIAAALGGRIVLHDVISVWRADDYQHVVIERGRPAASRSRARLERSRARRARIETTLGLRWTASSGFVSARGSQVVCVATRPIGEITTETFVRHHLERLPARVVLSDECLLPVTVSEVIRRLAAKAGKDPVGVEQRVHAALPATLRTRLYARSFRRGRVAAVLGEFGPKALEVHAACRRTRTPLVAHFHGYDAFNDAVVAGHGGDYRALFAEGWPVVAVSDSMKRRLIELGAQPEQVHVIRYGIDTDRFRPADPTPGLVVAVGRLVEKKAPQLVVRAFSRAARRVPAARLVVIGEGPLRAEVEELVDELGIAARVSLEGARDHGRVAEALRHAAVFVQHSVAAADGDREGTPVAVLEAGAAGVPVVATRHEGIPEVVVDGETGILVDEHDVVAMGDALADLLLDERRARRMGLAAREHIERLCNPEAAIERLWDVLCLAIAAPASSSV